MKSLSLKWKIILTGFVPLAFFLAIAGYQISEQYKVVIEAEDMMSTNDVIALASAVVHESQKERGRTAIFLSGGSDLKPLNEQRNINNQKISAFKTGLQEANFDPEYKALLLEQVDSIEKIRNQVNTKTITLGNALKGYTNAIKHLLDMSVTVANTTSIESLAVNLKGLRLLEDAKESGGKLRANLSAILAKNEAINEKQITTILKLKAGIDVNIDSPVLNLDEKEKELISKFKASADWQTVNTVFNTVLKKQQEGSYDFDSQEFFSTITKSLNILGNTINHDKDKVQADLGQVVTNTWNKIYFYGAVLGGLLVFMLGFLFYMVRLAGESINNIRKIAVSLADEANQAMEFSHSISNMSSELSGASHMQAAGLQETVTSIDEINSMVQKNAETANASTQISSQSKDAASNGKMTVETMMESMRDISSSNDEIMTEVTRSNDEITKIVSVISEIGDKTKVINDIVFQTKLLSFNASVEAARAGEHGKGFAVVAEEVGNLASMSGKAAQEITEMLDRSTKEVTHIVENAKGTVEKLMASGKEKVDMGLQTADQCGASLSEIMTNVDSVNEMIQEIATASTEQSLGIQEVTLAMQQLDQVTNQNTVIAQGSAETSQKMLKQAETLNVSIKEMIDVIDGRRKPKKKNKKKSKNNVVPLNQSPSEQKEHPAVEAKKVSGSSETVQEFTDDQFEDL